MLLALTAVVLLIGISLGATGYGGFLIPILLVAMVGMDVRTAVTHGLISFILPGLVGGWLYWRKHSSPRWRLVVALCVGTVPGVVLGRIISLSVSDRALQITVAGIVITAGASLLIRPRRVRLTGDDDGQRVAALLVALGAGVLAGLVSVIAGVGGPLITVPILLAMGLELATVVGAALLNSVFNVLLAAGAMASAVHVDWVTLTAITLAQLVGIPIGVWLQGRLGRRLVPGVGVLSVASGIWLLARSVI